MAEPCTKCGFSPLGEPAAAPPEVTIGSQEEAEAPPETAAPEPDAIAKAKRTRRISGLIWLAIFAAAWIGIDDFSWFDSPTGPEAGEVEDALVASAAGLGVSVTESVPPTPRTPPSARASSASSPAPTASGSRSPSTTTRTTTPGAPARSRV